MGAYKIELGGPPKCRTCGAKAKFMVHNTLNQPVGAFCARHADARVKELNDPKVLAAHTRSGY